MGGFYGASEIFLRPRKTKVCNFSCKGQNGVFIASPVSLQYQLTLSRPEVVRTIVHCLDVFNRTYCGGEDAEGTWAAWNILEERLFAEDFRKQVKKIYVKAKKDAKVSAKKAAIPAVSADDAGRFSLPNVRFASSGTLSCFWVSILPTISPEVIGGFQA